MNRLVIIGNGFDLAHGLPTSYGHFIDDYWKSVTSVFNYEKKSSFKDDFIEVNYEFMSSSFDIAIVEYKNINSYAEFNYFIKRYESGYSSYQYTDKNGCSLTFANKFFEIICKKSIENWVDIENVYYEILKGRAKGNYMVNNYPWDITQLNKEFEDVKNQLEKYLTKNILEKFSFKTEQNNNILNLFEPEIINPQTEEYNKFLNQFPSSKRRYIIEYLKVFDTERSINQMDKFFEKGYNDEVLILDFNYTPTTKPYTDKLFKYFFNPKLIKIHGELQNNQNKLNFGFGDEYDEDYKLIENINNNEYLKNIKSFQYLDNTHYREVMNFVFKKEFQVFIMGHSCGLSDRTLLQTIFEHDNCLSIKPYYYIDKNGIDDYSNIVYNISRNFKNKIMMRDKIVDKTLCTFLPQDIRFQEK